MTSSESKPPCLRQRHQQRPLNQTLYVLQTCFRTVQQPIFNLYLSSYKFFYMFLTFILYNFSVRTLKYFQKNLKINFCPQKLGTPPQKVAYLWQLGVVFLCSPDCPKQPRTSFPFYNFFYPTISCRISGQNSNLHCFLRGDMMLKISLNCFTCYT